MRQVKVLLPFAPSGTSMHYNPGEVAELDDDLAARVVAAGIAEDVADPDAVPETAPQTIEAPEVDEAPEVAEPPLPEVGP